MVAFENSFLTNSHLLISVFNLLSDAFTTRDELNGITQWPHLANQMKGDVLWQLTYINGAGELVKCCSGIGRLRFGMRIQHERKILCDSNLFHDALI